MRGKTLAPGTCLTLVVAIFLLALSLCACGQNTLAPAPTTPPSGSRLLWQGTLGPEDIMAPGEPVTIDGAGFWVSFSVNGDTGTGRNAIVAFAPVPDTTTTPLPTAADSVGRAWRVKDGDSYARAVPVPAGSWAWSLQKGLGYSVKGAVYTLP